MCLTTLARVLYNLNKNFEALAVMSTAMDRIVKRFFDYHPSRLAALRRLSMFIQKVGGHDAEPILREVATKSLRVLGPASGLTKSSMKGLKTLLIKQGRNDDAENMLRDLVDAASRLECMDDDCRIY
jgi:iron-sulfur cluster repair protein YtfE (RIC family)